MKVQVLVKNLNKASAEPTSTLNVNVSSADTALSLKENIASKVCLSSAKNQELTSKGKTISDTQRLVAFGISDGDVLELTFEPSEEVFVKQLSDLLLSSKQAISPEELGLLYTHRHGATIKEALASFGKQAEKSFQTFLERQKCIVVEAGLVKCAQPPSDVAPERATGPIEVHVSLQLTVEGAQAKKALLSDDEEDYTLHLDASSAVGPTKDLMAASLQVPWPERQLLLSGKQLEDSQSLSEAGATNGCSLILAAKASEAALAEQLGNLLVEQKAASVSELGLLYCKKYGATVAQALRTLGLHSNLRRFLESHSRFLLEGGCVRLADGPQLEIPSISASDATPQVVDDLEHVLALLSNQSFLNIARIEPSGRSGKEVTIFVAGLPSQIDRSRLLAGLRAPLAASLESALFEGGVRVADEEVLVNVSKATEEMPVRIRLAAA